MAKPSSTTKGSEARRRRWEKLFDLSLRLGWTGLALRLLPRLIEVRSWGRSGPTVLCLSRAHFRRDIAQLAGKTDLNILEIRSRFLSAAQTRLVDWESLPFPPERKQTFFSGAQNPATARARAATTKFARQFLDLVARHYRLDALLSANTDYWGEDGLVRACGERGLPFLVLSREHYLSEHLRQNRMKDYREAGFAFLGTAVAFFGEQTVNTLIETKACPRDRIHVTGAPRFDVWRDNSALAERQHHARKLTLLSFARGYLVESSFAETLRAFAQASREVPDSAGLFQVKCKNEEDRRMCRRILEAEPGHRLKLIVSQNVAPLLAESKLLVGFNSLALLEGLFTGAQLAAPAWGDAARNPHDLIFQPDHPVHREIFEFIPDAAAMKQLFLDAAAQPAPPVDRARRSAFFAECFCVDEAESASTRVERFIHAYTDRA